MESSEQGAEEELGGNAEGGSVLRICHIKYVFFKKNALKIQRSESRTLFAYCSFYIHVTSPLGYLA